MSRVLLAGVLLCLVGCLAKSDGARMSRLRSLEIAPPTSSPEGLGREEAAQLDARFVAALERALVARGYPVVASGGEGVVRCSWARETSADAGIGRGESQVGLSFSVFTQGGDRLYSARSTRTVAAGQWGETRLATEVSRLLRDLPEAAPASPAAR